jgi:hypothetical protein
MNRIVASGVGIALAATITLKADEKPDDGRFKFGAGVSIAMPAGSNLKSGSGFGPVFTAEMKLTDRQSLRGELGYVHYREIGVDLGVGEYWQPMSRLTLEADWVYSFSSDRRGLYILGGVGVANNAWKSFQFDPSRNLYSSYHNNFDPFFVVGGGYASRWLVVEHTRAFDVRTGRPVGDNWSIHHPKYGQR